MEKTESISNDVTDRKTLKDSKNNKIIYNSTLQSKQEYILFMFITNTGTFLVLVTRDKKIKVYNRNLNILIKEFSDYFLLKNETLNFAKSFSYDSKQNDLFIVGGSDKCLRIYSCTQAQMIKRVSVKRKSNYCATFI